MGVFRFVLLCTTFLVPARTVYPGYFSYPAATGPIFPNVIPQFAAPPPVFAYNVYTPGSPSIVSAPAPMARSIYTEPDDTYRGYSFETEYEGGGKSNVVFVTGPQANQLLQKSIELFRSVVTPEIEQLSGRSANSNDTTNATVVETPSTASAKSNSPIASHYHVQLYPAHTAPLLGPIMPFQNLVSSFAYSISNEIAASNKDAPEKAGEAQESMIHEVGSVVTAPPELLNKTSEKASHNSTESQANTPETSPQETTSTTVATTTTSSATTTIETTSTASESSSESSSTSSNPPEESNEVDESNATTPGSDEIMETTSA